MKTNYLNAEIKISNWKDKSFDWKRGQQVWKTQFKGMSLDIKLNLKVKNNTIIPSSVSMKEELKR